jgi:endonuclease/exonuclease/phosphatase family metal-dependent hydrolase
MHFKILLWNVAMTPSPPPHIGTRQAKERAPGIASLMRDYDIIVVNESFLYRDYLLTFLPEYKVYTEPKTWYKIFNSGVLILSKIPIENFSYMHYTRGTNWDWFVSKGLLGVSFQINGDYFHLYGTHLQAGNRESDHNVRLSQVNEIVNYIKDQNHDSRDTIILCGDFNCGPVYDPTFKHYSGHYNSSDDAKKRCEQYSIIEHFTTLSKPILQEAFEDDISSFIVHNPENLTIARVQVASNLSDTAPLALLIYKQSL